MHDMRVEGVAKLAGGEYGTLIIDGVGHCEGDIKAENLKIDGTFKCRGSITADLLECDGVSTFSGDIWAKKIIVDGAFKIKGAKVEAADIHCDGAIDVDGQISADSLKAGGVIRAREIVGDRIVINSRVGKITRAFMKYSSADLIEATTIELTGVTADTVNGHDVTIGPDCKIKNLDCSGTLSIDPSSSIETITGDYMKK